MASQCARPALLRVLSVPSEYKPCLHSERGRSGLKVGPGWVHALRRLRLGRRKEGGSRGAGPLARPGVVQLASWQSPCSARSWPGGLRSHGKPASHHRQERASAAARQPEVRAPGPSAGRGGRRLGPSAGHSVAGRGPVIGLVGWLDQGADTPVPVPVPDLSGGGDGASVPICPEAGTLVLPRPRCYASALGLPIPPSAYLRGKLS